MSDKNKKIDAVDEALKLTYLSGDTEQSDPLDAGVQLSYILKSDYPVQMPDKLSAKMVDELYEKLAVDSLGILLENALKVTAIATEELAVEASLPASTIELLKEDAILANSIPVMSFLYLLHKLNIPFHKVEEAIHKTFELLKNEAAFSQTAMGGLQLAYRRRNVRTSHFIHSKTGNSERQYLFQNKEALNKYVRRLGELYENK